ncbi:MAG: YjbH domain-containing protein, partial [Emcibacter sp.]|nr:YjbH domain-containing protein [Emcibacter sp.]
MEWQEKYGCKSILSLLTGIGYLSFFCSASIADETPYSYNNFGGIGLLDMRTARFAPDGTIAVGVQYDNQLTRYFSTWQATPWLETTLSYTDNRQGNLGIDRSLDVKIRLWEEGNYRPQLAIGIQDALGTGHYGAEYLVASKRYYDFDFTMGFAWGYLGSRGGVGNMFKLFGDSFDDRSITTSSGGIRTGSFFSGQDMSFFAGVEYYPPIQGLSLKAEYSGVDTTKISAFSHLKRNSAFNIGVNYKPVSWADVSVGFEHGDRVSFRLTLKQNLRKLKFKRWFRGPDPAPILERRTSETSIDVMPKTSSSLVNNDKTFDRLRRLGAVVLAMEQKPENIIFTLQVKEGADINPLVLLGAALESYDRVTLHIYQEETPSAQRYDAMKGDTIGRAALEKFRKTTVYMREKASEDTGSVNSSHMARSAYDAMVKAKMSPIAIVIDGQRAEVIKETGPYFLEVKNIGRTARILTREMPDQVEEFTIVSEDDGIEISRVSLLRKDLEKANRYQSSP